jgi:HSP20 family protein
MAQRKEPAAPQGGREPLGAENGEPFGTPEIPELDFESARSLDTMIVYLDTLYQSLTGRQVAGEAENRRPLPIERDPVEFVGEQLERLRRELAAPAAAQGAAYSPPLAAWEGEDALWLTLDVPGARRDQLQVTVEGRSILVRGRRPEGRAGARRGLAERPAGAFERRVLVPPRVDPESIEASLVDGVLELKLAKRPAPAELRREVRVA